jgi:CheY-like chemotaxis protein
MLKVLLLDDNSGNRFLNARILKRLHCHVIEAADPLSALQLMETTPDLDVAFVDSHMPVMNGLQFLEKAKLMQPHLPMIMTSVLPYPNAERIALGKGAILCMFEEQNEEDFEEALRILFPHK